MRETAGREKTKTLELQGFRLGEEEISMRKWKREPNRSFGYLVTDIMEKKTLLASINVKSENSDSYFQHAAVRFPIIKQNEAQIEVETEKKKVFNSFPF